jgi:4-hydroxybenzoate polyprenyltransferase
MRLRPYLQIARPDHWFKNVFVLPGSAIAALLTNASPSTFAIDAALAIGCACLVASANYVINEWLDARFDRFHPVKKNRPSVVGGMHAAGVYTEYAIFLSLGLSLAFAISPWVFGTAALFAAMGVLYNVEPFRAKDKVYLDVLSESVNNPIRLALGWFAVTADPAPPSSLLLGYWMAGAFLMGVKRFAELRFIGDRERAGLYRRSFRFYSEESLLISIFFYGACAAFFLGVFLVKHRVELLLSLPFLALLFAWYLHIGMKPDSPTQNPERLYQERRFALYVAFLALLLVALFLIDLPWLYVLLDRAFIPDHPR